MIEIRNLNVGYDQQDVLKKVNLIIPDGKVTVILGPNGCGKSTLLKSLVGIHQKREGEILLDGMNTEQFQAKELAQKIAYLSQDRQVPEITAQRLVLHGRFPYLSYPRRYRKEDFEMVKKAMEQMGVWELADRRLNTLSGGTRQKVYIAMALAQDTPVILLDEPTSFLDISYQLQMMEQARRFADSGKTVVMVLHDLALAMQHADYLVVMERGRVVSHGEPEKIYTDGCMNQVFRIELKRMKTEDGWRYYYGTEPSEHVPSVRCNQQEKEER